jgi:hypothetical protein
MAQDIVVETRGKNIVVGMPGTTYRILYRKPNTGRQLVAYRLPMEDDPSAAINSQQFMALAWRIATNRAKQLGWI